MPKEPEISADVCPHCHANINPKNPPKSTGATANFTCSTSNTPRTHQNRCMRSLLKSLIHVCVLCPDGPGELVADTLVQVGFEWAKNTRGGTWDAIPNESTHFHLRGDGWCGRAAQTPVPEEGARCLHNCRCLRRQRGVEDRRAQM